MKIAEVSKKYNLTEDTIRYYEKIGLIPRVPRTKSGIREFDDESCRWVEFRKCMRNTGRTIEVLKEYVNIYKQGEGTAEARKQLLIEQRKNLIKKQEEIANTIKRLDYKIEIYNEIVEGKRKDFLDEP